MTDKELMQMALDAMEDLHRTGDTQVFDLCHAPELIPALRARLAQPEPEPQEAIAKWIKANTEHREWYICTKCNHQTPRFKDEWQGLTDEERNACLVEADPCEALLEHEAWQLMVDIEAKLKDKNT